MHERDRIYVRGEWVASEGEGRFEVIDAATEEVLWVHSTEERQRGCN